MIAPGARTRLGHELRLLGREPVTAAVLLALTLALLLAAVAGSAWRADSHAQQAGVAAEDRERRQDAAHRAAELARDGGTISRWRDPRQADVMGRRLAAQHALLPPTALAGLASGQGDLLRSRVQVSLEPREALFADAELTAPRRLATGRFDAAFLIVFLAPLLVIALGHAVPAWEREQGLLPLLRLQRTRLEGWLTLRQGLRLSLLLLPILLASGWVVALAGAGYADLSRLGLWGLVAAAYLLFWAALTTAVAVYARSVRASLLALVSLWLALVLVLPGLAGALLNLRAPAPDHIAWVDAMRSATDQARAQGSRLLADYLEDHPELVEDTVDVDDFFAQRYVVQRQVEEALEPMEEARAQWRARRARQASWLRWLSPATLTAEALADAAGTGTARYHHFREQVEVFHSEWRIWFEPHILSGRAFTEHADIPVFRYREESVANVALRVFPALVFCLGGALGLAWWGRRGLRGGPP